MGANELWDFHCILLSIRCILWEISEKFPLLGLTSKSIFTTGTGAMKHLI